MSRTVYTVQLPAGSNVTYPVAVPIVGSTFGSIAISFSASTAITLQELRMFLASDGNIQEVIASNVTIAANTRQHWFLKDQCGCVQIKYSSSAPVSMCMESNALLKPPKRPDKVFRTMEVGAYAFRSYANGAYDRSDVIVQGTPGNGANCSGWAWHDYNQLLRIKGVPGGDFQYLDAYCNYTRGGRINPTKIVSILGWHNQADVTPVGQAEPLGGFPDCRREDFWAVPSGHWFTIFGTQIQTALYDGNARGLIICRSPNLVDYWGECNDIRIRAGWWVNNPGWETE